MRHNRWTDERLAALADLYPVETTARTAAVLGMSETAVKQKAKAMGLTKLAKTVWLKRAEYVRKHFHEHSFAEMARALSVTKTTVSRIATRMGLYRTKRERYRVSSRVRQDMVRRERRRVIFGLPPITAIKVVSNRTRVRLRYTLKSRGYLVGTERNTMHYPLTGQRTIHLEEKGRRLGLHFSPIAGQQGNPLYNAI